MRHFKKSKNRAHGRRKYANKVGTLRARGGSRSLWNLLKERDGGHKERGESRKRLKLSRSKKRPAYCCHRVASKVGNISKIGGDLKGGTVLLLSKEEKGDAYRINWGGAESNHIRRMKLPS